jgi:hypothetical protein
MTHYTDEELADNKLGLRHRKLGLFDQAVNDITVQHPDTQAYYDGRDGVVYRNKMEEHDSGEDEDLEDEE